MSDSEKQKDLVSDIKVMEFADQLKSTFDEMIVNERSNSLVRLGNEFISSFTSLDTKHPASWRTYGYKETLTFQDFFNMYRRFGMAKSGIELTVDKCWQTFPVISEDIDEHTKTLWEKRIQIELERLNFWSRCKGVDTRQRVGRYGGLLIIVRDGKELEEPLTKENLSPDSLVKLIPLYEAQMEISTYVSDSKDVDYGNPIMYQYTETLQGTNNRTQERSVMLHASRVIPWAEGSDTDNITTGVPALEACFNDLFTMEKIIGAGGEGFWKNARASLNMNYDKDTDIKKLQQMLGVDTPADIKNAMGDVVKKYVTGFDDSLLTQGADVKNLSVSLPGPKEYFEVALWSAASSIPVPATIWIGQQTGRLASDEDQYAWAQTNEGRRETFLKPIIRHTIDYLMSFNLLTKPPSGMYWIDWDSLLEPTQKQKLENSKIMSEINKSSVGTGQPTPFTSEQIALQAGKEYIDDVDDFSDEDELDEDDTAQE